MFMRESEEEEAEELKSLGNEQYKRGNFKKAIDFYTQAIGYCPSQKEYFGNRVLTLLKVERYDEALADCDSIKMLDSDWPKGMHLRGLVLEKLNRLEEAKREFERLVEIDPDHKVGNTRLADLNKRLGIPAKKKMKTQKKATVTLPASSPKSKSDQADAKQKKSDKKVQTLTALNKKLMQQFQESRKENDNLKKKLEKLDKPQQRPSKTSKKEEKSKQDSGEIKKLQKKVKQCEENTRIGSDENKQLRQSINKLRGVNMGKWNTEDIFKMVEKHTSQLQSLNVELRRRFGKKGGHANEV